MIRIKFFIFLFCVFSTQLFSQNFTNSQFPQQTNTYSPFIFYGTVLGSVSSLYFFADNAYYEDDVVDFHIERNTDGKFDIFDNGHCGIDKFGHIYSTSLFSQNLYFLARMNGYSNYASSWMAFGSAATILGAMEVWDGHFESWGFSLGDFTANLIGAYFPVAQQNIPFMRHIDYKLSYDFLADKSPNAGIHDYEHLTFWWTFNPVGLLKIKTENKWFSFFNIAAGYGFDSYQSKRQEFYIALDYRLKTFKPKNVFLRHLVNLLDRLHYPAPTIKFVRDKATFGIML